MPDARFDLAGSPVAAGGEKEADTHGMVVTGTGGTSAGTSTVGTITLPAGGPWRIFGAWGQVVPATATAAEYIGGHMEIDAATGDLDPDPAPLRLPLPAFGSFLGAIADSQVSPLNIWPVNYEAPGKAVLNMNYHLAIAATVAPQVVLGLIFGKTIPERRPIRFADRVRTTVTAATDTSVGTITLAEKASMITYIGATIVQDGVITAGEELIGFFRLDSDDIKMTPAQFPFSAVSGAGLGATIGNPTANLPVMIPVNIPVEAGARIACYVDLNTAVTNGADVEVFIFYE